MGELSRENPAKGIWDWLEALLLRAPRGAEQHREIFGVVLMKPLGTWMVLLPEPPKPRSAQPGPVGGQGQGSVLGL